MEKRIFYFVIAFIMSLGFTAAQAQNMGMMDKKSYVGVSAIISGEVDYAVSGAKNDEFNSGWLLSYGYQFTDMFAGELAYGRLSDLDDGDYQYKSELDVIEVSVLARMPGQLASPFVRLGYSDADLTLTIDGVSASGSESDFLLGVGVDFNIGDSGAIRLEYNQADYDGDDIERLQLGTIIRF